MNRMRLRIAERLKQSQNTAASLTTFNEVDMSSIMEFRKLYKDEILKNKGVKLGFMSAFSRACILAMRDVPAVNASIEGPKGGDTIVYRDYVDLSVAVATPKGLVTPVVRNAEGMNFVQIEQEIANLSKKETIGLGARTGAVLADREETSPVLASVALTGGRAEFAADAAVTVRNPVSGVGGDTFPTPDCTAAVGRGDAPALAGPGGVVLRCRSGGGGTRLLGLVAQR